MYPEGKHAPRARAVGRPSKIVEQPSPVDDPRGPMGIRLTALTEGSSLALRPATHCLLLPTDAGVDELRVASARHTVDRGSFALLPAGARATVETHSPVSHLLLLLIEDALARKVVAAYPGEIDPRRLDGHLGATQVLPRTNWLNEVCHRYLFERAVCKKRDNDATRFLEIEIEIEIVKELYFLCEARASARDRASLVEKETPLFARALGRSRSACSIPTWCAACRAPALPARARSCAPSSASSATVPSSTCASAVSTSRCSCSGRAATSSAR